MNENATGRNRLLVGGVLLGAGALAGAILAGSLSASAASGGASSSSSGTSSATQSAPAAQTPSGTVDESKSQRPDEHLLTGDTATKVRDAALAKYPGATILRVETDSDGVYEAHLVTAAGQRVTVEVGKDFTVTGEEQPPSGPPAGGTPGTAPSSGATSSSSAA